MRPNHLDLGIFLVSFAVLLTELLLTRIFSVTMYYHLSFMVVSLAMLGFAASGLVVTTWSRRFPEARLHRQASLAALAFGLTAVAAVGISFQLPVSLEQTAGGWLRLAAVYLACAVPFLCGGLVVSLILTHRAEQANRYYFFDLVGAALGCVAIVPATNQLGAATAVIAAAVVACAAAAALAWRTSARLRVAAVALGCALVVMGVANSRLGFYDVRFIKGQEQPPTVALRWNAFSRVDVAGTPESVWSFRYPLFAGFSARLDPDFLIAETWLRYDADAATQITYFDGNLDRVGHLRFDVSASAYQARRPEHTLIIGPGGGRDVLIALAMGSRKVTGVEINPITVELMRTRFRTFSGGLYDSYPGVDIIAAEGRSFLRADQGRYDLILASLVDTWAASAAGAYALTENNLYTVEAFQDYLEHLTPQGMVCFTRWFADPPVESLRVVRLADQALRLGGVVEPGRHVLIVRTDPAQTRLPSLGSILVKKVPFTTAEVAAVRRFADQMGFILSYAPDKTATETAATPAADRLFHRLLGPDADALVAELPYDISAVGDDRPFFFSRVPLFAWMGSKLGLGPAKWSGASLGLGGTTLLLSLVASLAFTVLLLVLPALPINRTAGTRHRVALPRSLLWALYFAGLGAGFIMVELVLIQRFSLFLGYPIYALSVVLFTILLASGVGSLLGGRAAFGRPLFRVLLGLGVGIPAFALILPSVLEWARSAALAGRILVVVTAVTPLAVVMGMPFPSGVRRVRAESIRLVPWAWAVNGGASVLGSTIAVVISMTYGFQATFFAGALAYGVALAAAAALARSPATVDAQENP